MPPVPEAARRATRRSSVGGACDSRSATTWATADRLVRPMPDAGRTCSTPLTRSTAGVPPLPPYITDLARRSRALPDGVRGASGVGRGTHRRASPDTVQCSTASWRAGVDGRTASSWSSGSTRSGRSRSTGSRTTTSTPRPTGSRPDVVRGAVGARRRGTGRGDRHHRRCARSSRRPRAGRAVPGPGEPTCSSRRGIDFAVVDVLMTNFHLPRSSLLATDRGVRRTALA